MGSQRAMIHQRAVGVKLLRRHHRLNGLFDLG
jgi:hypothetical protein